MTEHSTPDELLDLAEDHLRRERLRDAAEVEDAFDSRYATADLSPLQRGRRADIRGRVAASTGDFGVAEIAWSSAIGLYATAGDEVKRQSARARIGQMFCRTDRTEIGLPIVVDTTEYLVVHGPIDQHCRAYRRLGFAYLANGRLDDALVTLDLAEGVAAASDEPFASIGVQVDRAGMLAQAGRIDDVTPLATVARDESRAVGYALGIAATSWLLGRVAQHRNDVDEAVACYDEALTFAENPLFHREIRRQRAAMLATTPRSADAIDDLVAEVARAAVEGDVPLGMTARYHLANAYINASRPADAASLLEGVLADIPPGDASAESVRHLLSRTYMLLEEPDRAIEQLELVAASGTERGSIELFAEMNEQIAQVLDKLDRDASAAARFATARQAYRQADKLMESVRAGRRAATSHMYAGELPQAIEALYVVDRIALDLIDQEPASRWERAMLFVDGARIVEQHGDVAAAIFRCAPAIAMLTALGDAPAATFATLTYGEMLVRAGRAEEAEPPLRSVLTVARNTLRRRAASALAQALDDLGRPAEANEVRRGVQTHTLDADGVETDGADTDG